MKRLSGVHAMSQIEGSGSSDVKTGRASLPSGLARYKRDCGALFAATRSGAKIAFRQIHEPSGQPISYEKVAAGIGPVDKADIISGYEVAKGEFVLLEDREIEAVKIESKKKIGRAHV